jgi:NAD(P)-dependent dehydrogenase (short-subunit alcohol dehydrogenase family)
LGELDGKVAIVTGAGQGMGVGIAMALAKAGARVGLVDLNRTNTEETAARIAAVGGKAHVVVSDITDRAQVDATVAEITRELGPVWTLVNNAIAVSPDTVETIEEGNLELAIRTGIYGSLYYMQACFPTMKVHGGRIVNFGSASSTMGVADRASYNVAKEAIRGLTKTAAVGWGKYGITVNTVCPIAFTPRSEAFWNALTAEEQEKHLDQILLRRWGDAEKDIGATVVFLAGPGGSYITSRTLHVDGGRGFYDR